MVTNKQSKQLLCFYGAQLYLLCYYYVISNMPFVSSYLLACFAIIATSSAFHFILQVTISSKEGDEKRTGMAQEQEAATGTT